MPWVYPEHLTEQEFPFRGTTLICSEYLDSPILWNNSSFQGIGIENPNSLPIVFLENFIRWRKLGSPVRRPPNLGTSNIKNDSFLLLCKNFESYCCYKRDQPSEFGLWFLLLVEFKEYLVFIIFISISIFLVFCLCNSSYPLH